MGVLQQHRGFDAADREVHRERFVALAREHHLAALTQVDGDVGVERQPPLRQPLRIGDGVPDVANRVGQLPFETDQPSVRSALDDSVVGA